MKKKESTKISENYLYKRAENKFVFGSLIFVCSERDPETSSGRHFSIPRFLGKKICRLSF